MDAAEFNKMFHQEVDEELEAKNNIAYWFPILQRIRMRVPKTILVHTGGVDLLPLTDGEFPEDYMFFHRRLLEAIKEVGFPCFLRTGLTSDKHSWKDTCYITADSKLNQHVARLVEASCMANIAGNPWDTSIWAVRKLIPTKPLFSAFVGKMPIAKERRIFIKDGKVLCNHPYWPSEVFEGQLDKDVYHAAMAELLFIPPEDLKELNEMASYIARFFTGFWSVDFLQAADGKWWCTDMAVGERSYHWQLCEYANSK